MIDKNRYKNSLVFREFNSSEQKEFFDCKQKKYLHHIDNIYYSVSLEGDYINNTSGEIIKFIDDLSILKDLLNKSNSDSDWFDSDKTILLTRGTYAIFYTFRLSVNGLCDIYIAKNLPNDKTPRIVVQLRAEGIWSLGEYTSLIRSYEVLVDIFNRYGIQINDIKENRIDYAFHTNCIQNVNAFYSDKSLIKNLKSPFVSGAKYFNRANGYLETHTLQLGNRKSNNLFFRSYNKVAEILDVSHKFWFFDIWLYEGLISKYDYHVFNYCAKEKKKFKAIEWGMADFYINYGKNPIIREKLKLIVNDPNSNVTYLREIIKGLLPKCTQVFNIEFQTMRKFYNSSDNLIVTLPFRSDLLYKSNYDLDKLVKIFQILDNRDIFIDYLTSKTVSFVRDINVEYPKGTSDKVIYLDFWYRLRSVRTDKLTKYELSRFYKNTPADRNRTIKDIKRSFAKLALIDGLEETDINEDMSLAINILNDNDHIVENDGTIRIKDNEYMIIKEKQKKAFKSPLNNGTNKDLQKNK